MTKHENFISPIANVDFDKGHLIVSIFFQRFGEKWLSIDAVGTPTDALKIITKRMS